MYALAEILTKALIDLAALVLSSMVSITQQRFRQWVGPVCISFAMTLFAVGMQLSSRRPEGTPSRPKKRPGKKPRAVKNSGKSRGRHRP